MSVAPRKIGPVLATFIIANNMIGSGFFLLPATLAQSGSITALSWIVATAFALLLGGAFATLARGYQTLECPDDYVRPALGRDLGFLATTLYWLSSWIGNNAIAVAAFGYLAVLLPISAASPTMQVVGQVVLIWLMFALNLLGPRHIARFQSYCVVLGLAPVAMVLAGGWTHFDPATFSAGWNVTDKSDAAVLFGTLGPIFWAFMGFETGAMIAGLVRDPDRNVPRATIAGVLIAGAVYLLSSVLTMGIVPAADLAASSAPFALVAGKIFGAWAIPIIAAAAALKATGTLGGWMFVSGETGAQAARRGFLPAFFGRTARNGVAAHGLAFVTLSMSAIAFLTMSPTVAGQFGTIINMVVLLVVLAYAAAALSLIVGTPAVPSGWRERMIGGGALLACGLLIFSSPWDLIVGSVLVALLAWGLFRWLGGGALRWLTPRPSSPG